MTACCAPTARAALEAQVQEIERLAVTAHWSQSDARIDALERQRAALTPLQRHRLDYVRLRNRAVAGDQPAALKGLAELLKQDLPVSLRMRVYTTATGVAANLEDWALAFTWRRVWPSMPPLIAHSANTVGPGVNSRGCQSAVNSSSSV